MNLEDRILNYAYAGADIWAKTLTIPTIAVDYITLNGYIGVLPSLALRTLKKLPKMTVLSYDHIKNKQYTNYVKSVGYEFLTLIPFIGDVLEWKRFKRKKTKKRS